MKIIWNQNPLKTTIKLDGQEKELFRLRVIASELEENVGSAAFYLQNSDEHEYFKPEEAYRHLGYATDLDLGQENYVFYLSQLETGTHIGDCTCMPVSCSKCHAEYILGVDTIVGLGKHSAHKISGAFSAEETRTIHDVIEQLRIYEPIRSGAWLNMPEEAFTQHVPRWKAEALNAVNWLVAYRDQHFPLKPAEFNDMDGLS